ncbi:MAG: hypothetical protein ACE5JS_13080, partial [Nitrospinota bacterium]
HPRAAERFGGEVPARTGLREDPQLVKRSGFLASGIGLIDTPPPPMSNKDLDALRRFRPPRARRPRMSAMQAIQLYVTVAGWIIWMVVVGYFGLRVPERTIWDNLGLAGVIAVLTFVDLFGLWLAIGRWQVLRKAMAASRKGKAAESTESAEPAGAAGAAEEAEPAQAPAPKETRGFLRREFEEGILGSMPSAPGRLWRQVGWLGVVSVATAAAIFATGLSGWLLFLPGTGTVKGSIAIALTLWIFMEPIGQETDAESRRGILASRVGLGLGLLCFASDHFFPWFGGAGVLAGGVGAAFGKWGAGLYAAVISVSAWALQWWGITAQ